MSIPKVLPLVLGVDFGADGRISTVFGRRSPTGQLVIEAEATADLGPIDVRRELIERAITHYATTCLEWVYVPELFSWVLQPKGRSTSPLESGRG